MQFDNFALKLNAGDFASRSKAKAKPQRRTLAGTSKRTLPLVKESGLVLSQKIIRQSITQCQNN